MIKFKHTAQTGISLFVLISSFIFSCKKDVLIPASSLNLGDSIQIGDPINMVIHKFNDTIFPTTSNSNKEYLLDVDKDGISDIRLYTIMYYGISGYTNIASDICGLNGTAFSGSLQTDTLFLNKYTTTTVDTSAQYAVSIHVYNTFTYHQINSTDSICGISNPIFKLLPHVDGDLLVKKNSLFAGDTILLNKFPNGTPGIPSFGNDTVITTHNNYNNDRYTFPENHNLYVGIKKPNSSGHEKLGWVKLNCLSKNKVVILETAIQK